MEEYSIALPNHKRRNFSEPVEVTMPKKPMIVTVNGRDFNRDDYPSERAWRIAANNHAMENYNTENIVKLSKGESHQDIYDPAGVCDEEMRKRNKTKLFHKMYGFRKDLPGADLFT